MTPGADHSARDRLQRTLYFACGIGALVFGLLMMPGDSGIIAAHSQLAPWYWWSSIVIAVIVPASFTLTALWLKLEVLHAIAFASIVGFWVMQLLWVPAMNDLVLENHATPWLQGVTALPSTLTGVLFASRAVAVFPLSQFLLVPLVQLSASDTSVTVALLDGCGALIFCSILTALAFAVVGAGDLQDKATTRARRLAATNAAQRTAEQENSRINAMIHDDVMSVLLSASRSGTTPELVTQAQRASASIASLALSDDAANRLYSADDVAAVVRDTAAASGATATVTLTQAGPLRVPGEPMAALAEAVGEALRNCVRHAGDDAHITVTISVSARTVEITVADDGVGFSHHNVDPRRLGISLSIKQRVRGIPGGDAHVRSTPGAGTTVTVKWTRP
ncbi:ATP-binding protein [Demequina sp. B12]|uniref:sensor histidine kinase n=1 Tax=Demequina sp. B12 TaxID=2992757 RepID=UPI00237A4656|nr:sensor histidine kinase [Demequina sp. B12]MDE0572011.1 ATP-binding protein [Demequina sp. B12]